MVFLVLAVSVFFTVQTEHAFAQQTNSCQPHTVCVHPGDVLAYTRILGDINSSTVYNFSDMTDKNNIKVIQSQTETNNDQNTTLVLDITTGFVHSEQDSSVTRPFLEILPSPINYDKSDTSITATTTEFNGFKRTALMVFHSNENTTSKIEYDLETGILLEEHSTSIVTVKGNPEIANFADKLTSTNIINSDSESIKGQNVITIPKWIKNTGKSWAQGDIQDSEFIGAIQYLISNGIMHVPHGTSGAGSSQPIPTWIKHNTSMWSNGQITDDEFVQGIQWLITKGIIQVGN